MCQLLRARSKKPAAKALRIHWIVSRLKILPVMWSPEARRPFDGPQDEPSSADTPPRASATTVAPLLRHKRCGLTVAKLSIAASSLHVLRIQIGAEKASGHSDPLAKEEES